MIEIIHDMTWKVLVNRIIRTYLYPEFGQYCLLASLMHR